MRRSLGSFKTRFDFLCANRRWRVVEECLGCSMHTGRCSASPLTMKGRKAKLWGLAFLIDSEEPKLSFLSRARGSECRANVYSSGEWGTNSHQDFYKASLLWALVPLQETNGTEREMCCMKPTSLLLFDCIWCIKIRPFQMVRPNPGC